MVKDRFLNQTSLFFLTEAILIQNYNSTKFPVNLSEAKVCCHFEMSWPEKKETYTTLGIPENNTSVPEFVNSKKIFTDLKKNFKKYKILSEKRSYGIWTNSIIAVVSADNKRIARPLTICAAICQEFTQKSIKPITIAECFSEEIKPRFILHAQKFLENNHCDPEKIILPLLKSIHFK